MPRELDLSDEMIDRLITLLGMARRSEPWGQEELLAFLRRPITVPPALRPLPPQEYEIGNDTPTREPLRHEPEDWEVRDLDAEEDREVIRRLGTGRGNHADELAFDRIRREILSGQSSITREEALRYLFNNHEPIRPDREPVLRGPWLDAHRRLHGDPFEGVERELAREEPQAMERTRRELVEQVLNVSLRTEPEPTPEPPRRTVWDRIKKPDL
jgi:hypothetical protein